MTEIPQLKKISDSYKLLKGKYPSFIQRQAKVIVKRILLTKIKILLNFQQWNSLHQVVKNISVFHFEQRLKALDRQH